ncbi:MAG: NAD(P)/FAD-dependent oxidoreductase [Henriciella sp.]|nr:NAD(P)/FAD-dependent oxidoreductase [Henriciella sp.]
MKTVDALILGAGAAGLFCGARAAARGRSVLVLDHARKPAEKVRISGGGRCNFTNMETEPKAFISANPHFAKSALARYTPWDFCDLMAAHGLTWHEKTLGQLFCDQRSGAVIQMLLDELSHARGELALEVEIGEIVFANGRFIVQSTFGPVSAAHLIVATGGLSIPKMGATGLAYQIARQFGHDIVPTRPALVPLTFTGAAHDAFSALSGVSVQVEARAQAGPSFVENMLFTHRGLSGPAVLQISSYWREGERISVDLAPGRDVRTALSEARDSAARQTLESFLSGELPARLAPHICAEVDLPATIRLAELSKVNIEILAQTLKAWRLTPAGTEGWRTAEVTAGGVDTNALSSRTMESRKRPGLFFIGECVDVTGWLGGYNFQWAWASAAAAAEAI